MNGAASRSFEIPNSISEVFSRYFTTEYAYLTPKGEPLCWPVTPYWYPGRKILAIATGVAYPNKANYPKHTPKVSMLFSDPKGSRVEHPPVLVQGDAVVLDTDVQENTDRYVRDLRAKMGIARFALNPVSVRFLDFYLPRLWVEMAPRRIVVFRDPIEVVGEPLEHGRDPTSASGTIDHRRGGSMPEKTVRALEEVVASSPPPVLTIRWGAYPFSERRRVLEWEGNSLKLSRGVAMPNGGAACLTFHRYTLFGARLHAYLVRGAVELREDDLYFHARKLVGFFGNGTVFPLSLIPKVPQLRRSMRGELSRLGQPMPKLRIPRQP